MAAQATRLAPFLKEPQGFPNFPLKNIYPQQLRKVSALRIWKAKLQHRRPVGYFQGVFNVWNEMNIIWIFEFINMSKNMDMRMKFYLMR